MKFLDTMAKLKAFFDLFRGSKAPEDDGNAKGRGKRIALIVTLIISGILLIIGAALLLRKLKQRRLEKEAEQALDDYYSTDFDADEYADEDETYEEE